MNAENIIALALINLTTGSIYLKDGKLYHDDLGELPSVEEISAVVKNRPEIVGDVLLDDALDEGLPVEMDTRSVRRIASGAASVKDVERLTEARAEASRRVFCIGQEVMLEAGKVKDAPVWMKLEKKKTTHSAPSKTPLSEVAYILANELHIHGAIDDVDDVLLDRINDKTSTMDDIRALGNALLRVTVDD